MRFVWRDVEADGETMAALNALAADTPYIGHSTSLTRCRFRIDGAPERTAAPRRRVYPGRLAELERAYRDGRRPSPGEMYALQQPLRLSRLEACFPTAGSRLSTLAATCPICVPQPWWARHCAAC